MTKCDSLLVHVGVLVYTGRAFLTIQNQIDVKRLSWSVRDVIQINHNTDERRRRCGICRRKWGNFRHNYFVVNTRLSSHLLKPSQNFAAAFAFLRLFSLCFLCSVRLYFFSRFLLFFSFTSLYFVEGFPRFFAGFYTGDDVGLKKRIFWRDLFEE